MSSDDYGWVPLAQTAMWLAAGLFLLLFFRKDLKKLRLAFSERLAGGASVKVAALELGEVHREVEKIQQRVDDLADQVAVLFLSTMSDSMFVNLRQLTLGNFGPYTANDGLKRELAHLRNLGYVYLNGSLRDLTDGADLNDFAVVTPTGRTFVRLRKRLLPDQSRLDT